MVMLRVLVLCLVGSSLILGTQPEGDSQKVTAKEVAQFVGKVCNRYKAIIVKHQLEERAGLNLIFLEVLRPIIVKVVSKLDDRDPELIKINDLCKQINMKLDQPTRASIEEIGLLLEEESVENMRVVDAIEVRFRAKFLLRRGNVF